MFPMSDGTLQQRERNPATFVSEAMTCARELTTPELERIAELTKSSLVDQDMLNAQLFNLPAMPRWPCKRNTLRILLYCAAAGSDGFREHARGNVFWVIGILLLTSEAQQETAEQELYVQHCVRQYIWRTRRGLDEDLDRLIRTIKDQREIMFRESIVRAQSLMQLTTNGENYPYVLFRLQQSYSVFHAVALLTLQPIPAANRVARSIPQFPLPVVDVLSALIRCILHVNANAAFRERLLEACGDDAQHIMYGLQAALDAHARGYDGFARGPVLLLLQDLSSQTGLLPKEYWLSGIEEGRRMGSGGEAEILQGTLLRNSKRELIALRKIQHRTVTKVIFREAITHRQLRHRNILRFLGIFKMETPPGAIITPWVPNGDAFSYMKQNLTPDRFLCVTLGISSAVEYMHLLDPPVIHGDIRAKNILIDTDGTPKLCDFGLSRIKHEITRSQTSIAEGGYMTHMAPELSETEVFRTTPESDIFSFAMTIYELGTQSSPFAHITNEYAVVRLIQRRMRPDRPFNLAGLGPGISTRLWALIEQMWEHNHTRRPSATHVHRVLRQIDTEKNHGGAATSTSMPSPPISEPIHIETTENPTVTSLITSLSSTHISVPPTGQIPSSHVSLPNAINSTLHTSGRWSMTRCETLTAHTDKVLSVTYAPNRNEFASGSNDIRVWTGINSSQGTTWSSRFDWSIDQFACLSYTFDGALLAANSCREIRFWDSNTGEDNGLLQGHRKPVTALASSPSTYMMASGSKDRTVLLWDPRVMAQVGSPLAGHAGWITSVAFSRGGEVVASASSDTTVRLWDIRVGRCIGQLSGFTGKVTAASFSPDGWHIATASDDGTIHRWNVHTLERLGTPLRGHQAQIKCLAFSPDGTQIASGSADMMIRMWDASTGANVGLPLEGHRGTIESIAFSPDGDKMVSGARDKTVKVWSAAH